METGTSANSDFLYRQKRKTTIKAALIRLKQKNEGFMQSLERNPKWRKIYNGLLFNNVQSQLPKLVKLELCPADEGERSYFNPFQKIPISMCYNKFNDKDNFQQQALYNLMLVYDARVKRNMNWNNIQETARSTIRALNISKICEKKDKACFEREVAKRVLQKERFKGKELNFDQAYEAGVADMAPISQIS